MSNLLHFGCFHIMLCNWLFILSYPSLNNLMLYELHIITIFVSIPTKLNYLLLIQCEQGNSRISYA